MKSYLKAQKAAKILLKLSQIISLHENLIDSWSLSKNQKSSDLLMSLFLHCSGDDMNEKHQLYKSISTSLCEEESLYAEQPDHISDFVDFNSQSDFKAHL